MAVLCIPGIPEAVLAGSEIHGARTVVASRTSTPPVVDGHLGDPCWELAAPASGFVLLDPLEGVPAANQTFVRVLYTEDELYIGLYMADSYPENIDARIVPRDGRFAPRDLVGLVLDTHHDHRNAYGFYINPLGIQHDFQTTDDGAGGYAANNKGWDGVWRAEAAVLDSGWSAELAISFSTLAFAGGEMVWGFNVERMAITGRERSHWAGIYREDGSVLRVSKAGHLVGLRGIDPGLHLELLPHVASGLGRPDAGLDVKYGVATNATLDVTVNPDFAQVEADQEEINLSRFPLLLKERRPFFVEHADFLGRHGLFYSRRIADPEFGARFSGRTPRHTLGILAAQDRGPAGERPRFGVVKLDRELAGGSTAGALLEGGMGGREGVATDRGGGLAAGVGGSLHLQWPCRAKRRPGPGQRLHGRRRHGVSPRQHPGRSVLQVDRGRLQRRQAWLHREGCGRRVEIGGDLGGLASTDRGPRPAESRAGRVDGAALGGEGLGLGVDDGGPVTVHMGPLLRLAHPPLVALALAGNLV
ncbi:MAG: DUF5916 domain-containing protein [Gemmatimonadaceae bacterium]|nr:DUF5916 domain-containing protein [Gemmatimonadaceae bacterium]